MDLLSGLFLLLSAFGAGLFLAGRLGLGSTGPSTGRGLSDESEGDPGEQGVWGMALGLVLLAYGVLALGLAHWLSTGAVLAWCGALLLLGASPLVAWLGRVRRAAALTRDNRAREHGPAWTRVEFLLLALLCAHMLLRLVETRIPTLSPDALSYHLALPRRYLADGVILPHYDVLQSCFPAAQEMLFTAGLSLSGEARSGEPVAMLLAWAFHPLLAWALVVFVRRELGGGRREALLAAVLLFCGPDLRFMSLDMVDPATALYAFLGFCAYLRWSREGGRPLLAASAIALGASSAFKYFGIPLAAILGLLVLWTALRRSGATGLFHAAAWGLLVLAVAAPWYLRNYALTGNPFWPQLAAYFPSVHWDQPAAGAYWAEEHSRRKYEMGSGLRELLTLPWYVTMQARGETVYPISPLFLAFAPVILLVGRLPGALIAGLLWAAAYGAMWVFQGNPKARYLFPVLPVVAATAAFGVERLRLGACLAAQVWGRRVAVASLALVLLVAGFSLADHAFALRRQVRVALGRESREDYLAGQSPLAEACFRANRELPKDSVVLLFRVYGGYWLDRRYVYAFPGRQFYVPFHRYKTAAELRARLAELGVTHVLLQDWPAEATLPTEAHAAELLQAILSEQGTELFRAEARLGQAEARVYSVRP